VIRPLSGEKLSFSFTRPPRACSITLNVPHP
jgi:hypothetical protein